MVRFSMNRWLGFVLTLCLVAVSLSLLSAPSSGAIIGSVYLENPGDGSDIGAASASGDPDVPLGPGDGRSDLTSRSIGRVQVVRTVSTQEARLTGDVTTSGSVWMSHMRLLLLSLRGLNLGF
jgi:hypothetical protein